MISPISPIQYLEQFDSLPDAAAVRAQVLHLACASWWSIALASAREL